MVPNVRGQPLLAKVMIGLKKLLLDTNAVIALLKWNPVMVARLREHAPRRFWESVIAALELYFDAFKSARTTANLARIGRLGIPIVDFAREDTAEAGRIRATLASDGTQIGPYEVLIAGQAKVRELILITRDTRPTSPHELEAINLRSWPKTEPLSYAVGSVGIPALLDFERSISRIRRAMHDEEQTSARGAKIGCVILKY